jgi:hypothetical protein
LKSWEIIADNLKKAGRSLGWASALDSEGRTIWVADAHRDDGKRFVVRADEVHHGWLLASRANNIGSLGVIRLVAFVATALSRRGLRRTQTENRFRKSEVCAATGGNCFIGLIARRADPGR